MFKTCNNKGFHIKFPNGITLSTQFGPGNYGDNYDDPFIMPDGKEKRSYQYFESEVAAWDEKGKWITDEYRPGSGGVIGYLDIGEWLKFFDWCRNYKP